MGIISFDHMDFLILAIFNVDLKTNAKMLEETKFKKTNKNSQNSYNWCPDSTPSRPAFAIPGNPSLLKDKFLLHKLTLNKYARKADENKTNFPKYPIEPIYRWSIHSFNYQG